MKNIFKIFLLATLICSFSLSANAQSKTKLGHINSNDLLLLMPERKDAEAKLQAEAKKLESQLAAMTTEYQTKVQEYQANVASYSDLIKSTKAQEIGDLEKRIQEFQVSAQDALQQKESELLAPIIDKAKAAIDKVADTNGYTYIFDSGLGVLLTFPKGDDIMPLVKKEMGLL